MLSPKPIVAIIENDLSLLKALARLVSAFGYHVETFSSAELYLQRSISHPISCILLDINLDGMSGLELQKQLRSSSGTSTMLPIVFISGRDDVATISEAVDHGCLAYLHKPINSSTLRMTLAKLIE